MFWMNTWRKGKDFPVRTRQYQPLFICATKWEKCNSLKSLCSTVFKEFHLHPSSKQRSASVESRGSPGGVLSNTLKKVNLISELQKSKEICSADWNEHFPVWSFFLQAWLPIKQIFDIPLRTRSITLLIIFFSISFG